MAEDYKPRPSGGSSMGIIVGIVAAVILLPLLCCGVGFLSFFGLRSEAVQVAPPQPVIESMPAQSQIIPEEPGIVLPTDVPDATTPPATEGAKPPE